MIATPDHQAPAKRSGARPDNPMISYLGRNARQYGIVLALVVIVIIFWIATLATKSSHFITPATLQSLLGQNAYVLILAIGMCMVIVAGHIDLSVGSVVAFVGAVIGTLMYTWDVPWGLTVLIGIVMGLAVGAWQGLWIAYVRIPAFIVSLSSMLLFRGLANVILNGKTLGTPPGFNVISNSGIPKFLGTIEIHPSFLPAVFGGEADVLTLVIGLLGIAGFVIGKLVSRRGHLRQGLTVEPTAVLVFKLVFVSIVLAVFAYLFAAQWGISYLLVIVGVLVVAYSFVQNRTVYGRHTYAIGGNLNAAILSGVNTKRVNFLIFINMGLLAAIAGIVMTARLGSAAPAVGQNFELDAIAACFIGGTAVTGGVGRISGAMVGALIMGVLNMGLSILGAGTPLTMVIKGLVLLAAVAFDLLSKRRSVLSDMGQR